MQVLTVLLNNFSLQRQHVGLDNQPLFRKGTSLEPRERRKSSIGSMLMIALYLILTIKGKKKNIQTTTTTTTKNKQTKKKQTSIVFLHLL